MPYKDKAKDRRWHKIKMRTRRKGRFVTPIVIPKLDADGQPIPSYD